MQKVAILCFLVFLSLPLAAQKKPAPKPKAPAASADLSASIAQGKKIYSQYCLSCHQADGGGVQNMNPPLIKTSYVLGDKTLLTKELLNVLQDVYIDD